MLYPTLNQGYVFLMLFLSGMASGLLFDFANFLTCLLSGGKVLKQIFYFFAVVLNFVALFAVNLATNFGQFRIFIVLAFLLALLIERLTLGKLLNKLLQKASHLKIKLPKLKRNKKEK